LPPVFTLDARVWIFTAVLSIGCAVAFGLAPALRAVAAGQTSDLFLFVVAAGAVPDAPASATPTFSQVNRLAMASWHANGNTYLLATEHGEAELRKLL